METIEQKGLDKVVLNHTKLLMNIIFNNFETNWFSFGFLAHHRTASLSLGTSGSMSFGSGIS